VPEEQEEFVQVSVTIGDNSDSHSGRWAILVGSQRVETPDFGNTACPAPIPS
jgi:hypothetical protein